MHNKAVWQMKNLVRMLGFGESAPPATDNTAVAVQEQPEVKTVELSAIIANPFQPRKTFVDTSLQELAASIAAHGIIQPLLVRPQGNGYELIAGERRLRAAKMAGLKTVPAIVKPLDDRAAAELAMIENLQREDLHYLEEADGYQQLLQHFGLTQEELAQRVGKSQSTIANKLRLLRLPAQARQILLQSQLTERHARALLRLPDAKVQLEVLQVVVERGLNVRETESLVDAVTAPSPTAVPRQRVVPVIRDVRIFINTINKVVQDMQRAGLAITVEEEQNDDYVIVSLRLPKRRVAR